MSEEADATVDGGAEESAQVETTSEATTEQDTGTEESGQADDTGEATEEPAKRVPWFQKRIDEVTAKKYEAEREAAYWRGIAEGRTPAQEPQAQPAGPPDRWEDPDGYDRWLIQQATEQFAQQQQRQTTIRTYEEREAAAKQAHPDFDSVVRDPNLPITPLMADLIRESEVGPEVAYHLGTNREEARRIANLPPHQQAKAFGVLEAKLVPQPAQTTSNKPIPPNPPKTVGAVSSGLTKPLEEMSMAEYIAARNGGQS